MNGPYKKGMQLFRGLGFYGGGFGDVGLEALGVPGFGFRACGLGSNCVLAHACASKHSSSLQALSQSEHQDLGLRFKQATGAGKRARTQTLSKSPSRASMVSANLELTRSRTGSIGV